MFDNENNEQNKVDVGGRSETETNSENNYQNNQSKEAGTAGSGSYVNGASGSTYGSGNTNGSTYGGSNVNNSVNRNDSYVGYNPNGNAGSYGNYNGMNNGQNQNQNQNTYGNYHYGNNGSYNNTGNYGNGTYGNYQYSNYQPGMNGGNGPHKRGTGKKVAAAIAIAMVLFLGLGAGYYSMTKISQMPGVTTSEDKAEAGKEDNETAKADSNEAESSESADDAQDSADATIAANNAESGIAQTETIEDSRTVVTDVTEVVAKAMPAMVSINNNYTQSASYFGQTYSQELTASGSGIIVGTNESELLIATNYHVIEGADSLEVQFVDENTAKAEVKGTDSNMDLAVIAVQLGDLSADTKNAIAIATLGDSDSLTLGEPAIAIGNALGYGQSVTTGVVSAVNRAIDLDDSRKGTFVQTSAAINPGNSGGALLNISGEVIGINSNKIGGEAIEGMGYAIPISTAKPIIEQLMTEKTRSKVADEQRGYLGISGVSVTSDVSQMYGLPLGVYVASVSEDGGAKAAGVQEGDIITKFDGKEISSMDDLQNRLAYYEAGENVTITVQRQAEGGYQDQEIQITLGTKPSVQSDSDTDEKTYHGEKQPDAKQEDGQEEQEQQGRELDPFQNPFGFGFNFGN